MTEPTRPERRPILRLEEATVARIAAGEVVEGPASVVKELVENAWDAGATEVRIALALGGFSAVTVRDDGLGILPAELPLAVERHATSKLARFEDLGGLRTMGFRGEALASLAAVARLRLLSRTAGADAAHGIEVEGGHLTREFVEGAPPGTTVEVRDLFFNTPARRQHQRSPAAEQVEVTRVLGALYLARPGVGLTLEAEAGELARFPPSASLADAAVRVLGPELLGESIDLRAADDGSGVAFRALLSRPTVSRGSAGGLHIAVNGRAVVSRSLAAAVRLAYTDYLPRGRYPIGAVDLTIDPARVDVNVHPTKREVRIAKERDVADRLRRAVREALRPGTGAATAPSTRVDAVPTPRAEPGGPAVPSASSPVAVGTRAGGPGPTAGRPLRLDADPGPVRVEGVRDRPKLALLGPLFRLYWVAESDDALVLVDQHAASERVVYDTLRRTGRLARQALVEPVPVTLTARQSAALRANGEAIASAGFRIVPFGPSTWRVEGLPVYRGRRASAPALLELLDELAEGGRGAPTEAWEAKRAASIACHAAVRGGDVISAEEMARILEELDRLEGPAYACPHGRPILVRLDRRRLDQWFLRSSP